MEKDKTKGLIYFRDTFPRDTFRKGDAYFQDLRVTNLAETDGGGYIARVRGTRLYDVVLTSENGTWTAQCSCPMGIYCKHIVAVICALTASPKNGPSAQSNMNSGQCAIPGAVLAMRLEDVLKRKLAPDETRLVVGIGKAFRDCLVFSGLQAWIWNRIFNSHKMPNLPDWCTERPSVLGVHSEQDFWELLACIIDEQKAALPSLMAESLDMGKVRERFAAVRRQLSMREWHSTLGQWAKELRGDQGAANTSGMHALDIRLRLGKSGGSLEISRNGDNDFAAVRTRTLLPLLDQYRNGELRVHPESVPLWDWCADNISAGYVGDTARIVDELKRLVPWMLKIPSLAGRLINAAGKPLVYRPERLQRRIFPPDQPDGDYLLRVVRPDGTALPADTMVIPARTSLYVTDGEISHGPDPIPDTGPQIPAGNGSPMDKTACLIPAIALESREGAAFLNRLDPALLQGLRKKIRRVPFKLLVRCSMVRDVPALPELASIRIIGSSAESGCSIEWAETGWTALEGQNAAEADSGDELVLFDDTALRVCPGLLNELDVNWRDRKKDWVLRVTKSFPEVFSDWLKRLPADAQLELDAELASLGEKPIQGSLKLDITPAGVDWFDLQVVVNTGDLKLTPTELQALLNARGDYVKLDRLGWRRLIFQLEQADEERLAGLGLKADDFTAEKQRVHVLQLADPAAARFLPDDRVDEIRLRADELKTRVTPPVPGRILAKLRPYQEEGYHFLAYLSANRFGGILADDMGLGKTLQALTWITWLRSQPGNAKKVSLVVCPKSVMDNWSSEAGRFADGLRVLLRFESSAHTLKADLRSADVIVINYAQLRILKDELAAVPWLAVILDEGQYIKNPQSQTTHAACALKAEHRVVLTGTPIENRLMDLWSLMHFAMPGILGPGKKFRERHDQSNDPMARRRLAARVRPFLLRRTKSQVATDLPEKTEEDIICEMEGEQAVLYKAEFKHTQQILLKIKTDREFDHQRFNILASLLRLRQICCHPGLADKSLTHAESTKLTALEDMLEPLIEEGHKVLVFSQFVTMLEIIKKRLAAKKWPHFILTGETEDRGKLVDQFREAKGAAVFLISLRAGGFGLNLSAASYVVLCDPWWNPAVESQAIDRTHRIGQVNKVIAYRLLVKDTIEEKIRKLQQGKRALADDVLGDESFSKTLTLDDLRFLFEGAAVNSEQ
jgi:superfamily II DNA or RNA helicase